MQAYTYHVVKLAMPVHCREYVCVPFSWIKMSNTASKKVRVAYPPNQISIEESNQLVKDNSDSQEEWPLLLAEALLGTDNYEEALHIINIRLQQVVVAQLENIKLERSDEEANIPPSSNADDNAAGGDVSEEEADKDDSSTDIGGNPSGTPQADPFEELRLEFAVNSKLTLRDEVNWKSVINDLVKDKSKFNKSIEIDCMIKTLLEAVFKDSALKVCTRTGKKRTSTVPVKPNNKVG